MDEQWEEPSDKQGGHALGLILVRSPPVSGSLPAPGSALDRVPVGNFLSHVLSPSRAATPAATLCWALGTSSPQMAWPWPPASQVGGGGRSSRHQWSGVFIVQ